MEKHIKKILGKTRQELGREKFNEEIWRWKDVYGGRILEQLKRLGCSLDWSQCHFTLDQVSFNKLSNILDFNSLLILQEPLRSYNRGIHSVVREGTYIQI